MLSGKKKISLNEFPLDFQIKPGRYVTCASDLGWEPGYFPKALEIDGQYFSRYTFNGAYGESMESAEYVGAAKVIVVFND